MGFVGSFAEICRFLYQLETMPQTLWLEDVQIEKCAKNTGDVQCEIILEIFADNIENSDQVKGST
jgi:hypothetical protein